MTHGPIVLVGGMTSLPRRYDALARTLRDVSGSEVYVAPLTPLDWLLGHMRGYGQLVFEIATTVDRALLESAANKAVLVGHSAGGLACRIFIGGAPPYGGRRYSGHRRVSRLITLGTPHLSARNKGPSLVARVNELFPGALHAANLEYLSVAGTAADGATSPRARRRYERLLDDGRVPGDGVVPVGSALLPHSEQLVLDDLYHNHHLGRWYGSDKETVTRWWPRDLYARTYLAEERRGS
ncbi:MAG TPA: hypothetical protein VK869_07505 [Rubrobacteraceae bacterium]|nr:hypothetical protein [Rubrobacteraceae bacterium]